MPKDVGALEDGLPRYGSPEFEAEKEKRIQEVAEKYAWVAQQNGLVLRHDPLKMTYRDYAYDRIVKVYHSFLYRDTHGRTKTW